MNNSKNNTLPISSENNEFIDVEIIESSFPDGLFVGMVKGMPHEDAFEYWVGEDKDISRWKELIISTQDNKYIIVDGMMAFVNIDTGEIVETSDTSVFNIEDVDIIWNKKKINSSEEMIGDIDEAIKIPKNLN